VRKLSSALVIYAIVLCWLILTLFPFIWLFLLSLKTSQQAFRLPPLWFFQPTSHNYVDLVLNTDFVRFFGNSIIVAVGTVILSLLLGAPAAYAFARARFRLARTAFLWTLIVRMAPGMCYVIPFFVIYHRLGLLDTPIALIILYSVFNLALVIWSMHTFFSEVPVTLEEAARVDGASILQVFIRIVLPLSGPGLAATAILCFLFSWNEFLFALIITRNFARTAPLAIVNFIAYEGAEWGRIAAGSILVIIPVIVFSFLVRRYLVRGLIVGAVKG
jgi:multiple sugar transport system permease protein